MIVNRHVVKHFWLEVDVRELGPEFHERHPYAGKKHLKFGVYDADGVCMDRFETAEEARAAVHNGAFDEGLEEVDPDLLEAISDSVK